MSRIHKNILWAAWIVLVACDPEDPAPDADASSWAADQASAAPVDAASAPDAGSAQPPQDALSVLADVAADSALSGDVDPADTWTATSAPALTHPVDSAAALVRILNLQQLAPTSAAAMVHRMYSYGDPLCPGGQAATPSTSLAAFQGACHVQGGEGAFDVAGMFSLSAPNTCNANKAVPTTATQVTLSGLHLSGTWADAKPVELQFDLDFARDAPGGGVFDETWTGRLAFDHYVPAWTPCCNASLSVYAMLAGTRVTGTGMHHWGSPQAGHGFSGLLDIAGEGSVQVSTPENLTYDDGCWKPKSGVIRMQGKHLAEIHFSLQLASGSPTAACTQAKDTTYWTLDGLTQGPIAPNFWGSVTICIVAVGGAPP